MNALPLLLRHALVETLGWVLVHSLWQIALIGLLFAATNRALAGRSANARYAAGCVALAAMLLVPVGSVWLLPLHGFAAAVSNSRGASEDGLREADSQGSGDEVRRAAIRRPAEESLLNENNASSMPAATETSVHPADKLAPKRDWRMTLSTAVRPWLPAAVALWMLGVALCSLRLVYGCAIVRRLRRIGTSAVVEPVAQTARTLMQRMRIRRRVLIVESRLAASPALIGYFKPVVLLPVAAITGLTTRQLEAVIAHELAHVRRHDFLVNALQSALETLLFFHPAVWLVSRQVRLERENCCDDLAASVCGSRADYADALLAVAEMQAAMPQPVLAAGGGSLLNRIRRLAGEPARSSSGAGALLIGLMLLTVAGLISVSLLAGSGIAQNTESPAKRPPTPGEEGEADAPIGPKEIAGTVIDGDGKPLAGVLVDAWTWHPGTETRTDEAGRFRLRAADEGDGEKTAQIRFSKPGYSPYMNVRQPLGETLTVVLGDKTYFEGRVTAPDGSPASGAKIRADQGPKEAEGVVITGIWTEATADEHGRYRLYVQPDTYDIHVHAPGSGVARLSGRTIAADTAMPLDVKLDEGVTFRARVVDSETGKPVAGICLWHFQQLGFEGVSDDEGRIAIDGMLPGEFEFMVTGRELLAAFKEKQPLGRIATKDTAQGYARWWSKDCASEHNRFQVRDGGWQRNFDHLDFELRVGMEPVTIEVEKAVRIRGKVLDPDGKPVAGATVAPALTGTGNSITGDTRYSFRTKRDGSFEMVLPASKEAEYNLIAHDGKYGDWRTWANGASEPMTTKPGELVEDLVLRLERPASVRGTVKDREGNPVPGHKVRAVASELRSNRYYVPETKTDEQGRFEIKFAQAGEQYIQTMHYWRNAPGGPAIGPAWSGDPESGPAGTFKRVELRPGDMNNDVELIVDVDPPFTPPFPR